MLRRLQVPLPVLAISTAAGVYFATQLRMAYPDPMRRPWGEALAINLAYYWAWGAAVPLVRWLAGRLPLDGGRWARSLLAHLPCSVAVTLAQIALAAGALSALDVGPYSERKGVTLARAIRVNFHSSYPTYWLILAVLVALDYHARYRDRALRAAQLEGRLAEARLAALRMQLNPHFLFNALNSISSLMYTDVEAADSMMRKLGDLLRLSLDRGRGWEISLREELELVERYLDVERVRFEERLRVRLDVDPALLDALVPAFALQPLVENAVRHSIAPRPEGGRLEIAARRTQDRLVLSVWDDGPGLEAGAAAEGVGLANTRARLEQLYGQDQGLRLLRPPEGGLRVEIALPCRMAA